MSANLAVILMTKSSKEAVQSLDRRTTQHELSRHTLGKIRVSAWIEHDERKGAQAARNTGLLGSYRQVDSFFWIPTMSGFTIA